MLFTFTSIISNVSDSRKFIIELLAWSFVLATLVPIFLVIRLQYVDDTLLQERHLGILTTMRFGFILLIFDRQNREKIRIVTFFAVSLAMLMSLSKMSIIVLIILWILRLVSWKSLSIKCNAIYFVASITLKVFYGKTSRVCRMLIQRT